MYFSTKNYLKNIHNHTANTLYIFSIIDLMFKLRKSREGTDILNSLITFILSAPFLLRK